MAVENIKIIHSRTLLCLLALFALALLPRVYSALTMGWDWDQPGSFTLINFDEGGSCRAALEGFNYSTFIGRQTIALSELAGHPVPAGVAGDAVQAKAYCHSATHIQVARLYSALMGSLTVVLLGLIGLLLQPSRPQVAWTAAGLLALSGVHVSESHVGTVDAPSVFFIYLFITAMIIAVGQKSRWPLVLTPLLLIPALWAKYWVFALFAYIAPLPAKLWRYMVGDVSSVRVILLMLAMVVVFSLVTNAAFQAAALYPLLGVFWLLVPWRQLPWAMRGLMFLLPFIAYGLTQVGIIADFTTGDMEGKFGASYAAIGWNKWLRNIVNVPAVLLVGLGIPAFFFIPRGIKAVCSEGNNIRGWLCLAPVAVFAAYMMFIAPVTYYRHYLALVPAAALLASVGLWSTNWAKRRWFLCLLLIWQALLMVDVELDYHRDPRVALRAWYEEHPAQRVLASYYVNPPKMRAGQTRFFQPELAFGEAAGLKQAHYLILSENWYDTAFANELNGPWVGNLDRLIKTKPVYTRFYRQVLANEHPNLILEQAIDVANFMPELLIHKWFYGTYQLFVGDLKIYKIAAN